MSKKVFEKIIALFKMGGAKEPSVTTIPYTPRSAADVAFNPPKFPEIDVGCKLKAARLEHGSES